MNYFIGSLYGNYEGYLQIKDNLKLKPYDTLWILGDVLDGNDTNPEESVKIVQDIAHTPNINLILGDHEFAHIMRNISMSDKDAYDGWKEYLTAMDVSGDSLIDYFENEMDEYDLSELFTYLIDACEVSKIIQIGDNYFYLTHGFPSSYNDNLTKWQLDTVTGNIHENYYPLIMQDPSFSNGELTSLTKKNTFVICSHTARNSSIYHQSGVFLLGGDIPNQQIPILGIDAAGYFFHNIIYS